jgi:hypothetical protein
MYFKFVPKGRTGRPPLNPRIVIGSLIIKHIFVTSKEQAKVGLQASFWC